MHVLYSLPLSALASKHNAIARATVTPFASRTMETRVVHDIRIAGAGATCRPHDTARPHPSTSLRVCDKIRPAGGRGLRRTANTQRDEGRVVASVSPQASTYVVWHIWTRKSRETFHRYVGNWPKAVVWSALRRENSWSEEAEVGVGEALGNEGEADGGVAFAVFLAFVTLEGDLQEPAVQSAGDDDALGERSIGIEVVLPEATHLPLLTDLVGRSPAR